MTVVSLDVADPTGLGRLVAMTLNRSWVKNPPPLDLSPDELLQIRPMVLKTGSAALLWRRIGHSSLNLPPLMDELRDAVHQNILNNLIHERQLIEVVDVLRASNIESIVAKGWAVGRLYPERGIRPSGDIDVYVRADDHSRTLQLLQDFMAQAWQIDVHRGFHWLEDHAIEGIFGRSAAVPLGRSTVRCLGAEDHLRLLSLHMLGHGAWRPLWLCDVAVLLESLSPSFDWEYCLRGNSRRTDWMVCVLKLAKELLGAREDCLPQTVRGRALPPWLLKSVLKQWGKSFHPHGLRTPMRYFLSHPGGWMNALRERWPNPIEATVDVGGPFNDFPRLPFQVCEGVLRVGRFAVNLPKTAFSGSPRV